MEQIVTSLMFVGDAYGKAEDAIGLYVSLFPGSQILELERFAEDEDEVGLRYARFGDYGFAPLFGWLNDRFGVSWQLRLGPARFEGDA